MTEIRTAQITDAQRLAQLCTQLGYSSSPEQIQSRLADLQESDEQVIFVSVAPGGQVSGFLCVAQRKQIVSDPQAEILALVVDETVRSQGVGLLLLKEAELWARERGLVCVGVRSNVIREGAHRFYLRHGYEVVKQQYAFRKYLSAPSACQPKDERPGAR